MPSIRVRLLLMGACLMIAAPAQAEGVSVGIDMTKPVRFEREAASVVVGNPAIADLYVQNGQLIFVMGRSFGATNIIALDAAGKEIANIPVTVTSIRQQNVTLERGPAGRMSYACHGRCEVVLMPGDDPAHFKELLDGVIQKTAQADAVAESASKNP